MDLFTIALGAVLALEGFYSNDKADKGGETVYGIARKMHPDWLGWSLVDKAKASGTLAGLKSDPAFMRLVGDFYRAYFWDPCGCDNLPPRVAPKVFEIAVNCGTVHPVRLVQSAIATYTNEAVLIDGVMGPATVAAVKKIDPDILLESIRSNQVVFYESIVKRDPTQKVFILGWFRRARS